MIFSDIVFIIAVLAGIAIGVVIGFILRKKMSEAKLASANDAAEALVEDAKRDAERIKKEAELKAKDLLFQGRQEFDKEVREQRKEIQSIEKRLVNKEEQIDKKVDGLEKREAEFERKERDVATKEKKLEEAEKAAQAAIEEQKRKLEAVSGMSAEEAKKTLVDAMEGEAKIEAGKLLKKIEEETRAEADEKAKNIIALAIQRYAGEYVAEKTVSVVHLPSDEMKGRIIGREGRNIRAIEAATGIDIIIDDTPEAVILSGHNPVRREVAKRAIERLIQDGRIHPARIEELVTKVEADVEKAIVEAGERAVFDTGLHGVHPEIQKLIGRLKYRTSYGQNVYAHSLEVSFICGILAAELKLPTKLARRAGLLHDIGKAVDHEVEGSHATIGADLAKKYGERQNVIDAIGQHHENPEAILGILVQVADTLSAARPGARREMYEAYIKRLEDLEKIANSFKGVEKSYALQAGREVRVLVESNSVDDNYATVLSKDIANRIEKELTYPGMIKVTVIRETRSTEFAR
ncbi:MAG: ribonuclease Y [Deltaproteobacteria bacterium]|nr:ribonuclease Y [Deltaproteobacteria bacterium]